jgi:hypothetical protein
MYEDMKAVATDLNADGTVNVGDRFGLAMWEHNVLSLYTGSGVTLVERDSSNMPVYNGLTEKLTDTFTSITQKFFTDTALTVSGKTRGSDGSTSHTEYHNGNVLFYIEPLGSIKAFRDVEFEVGLLPAPKYSEEQTDYISYIYQGASACVVPITNNELDKTAVILENLAAESYRTVMPIYFDVTLAFKYIQDEQSQKMLDIVFSNGKFDLARVYGWGNFGATVCSLTINASSNFTSAITALDGKISGDIDKTLAAFGTN